MVPRACDLVRKVVGVGRGREEPEQKFDDLMIAKAFESVRGLLAVFNLLV